MAGSDVVARCQDIEMRRPTARESTERGSDNRPLLDPVHQIYREGFRKVQRTVQIATNNVGVSLGRNAQADYGAEN